MLFKYDLFHFQHNYLRGIYVVDCINSSLLFYYLLVVYCMIRSQCLSIHLLMAESF